MANPRPAEQWYSGDWFRAVDVKKCDWATIGIWREMLDIMVNEQEIGKIKGMASEICRVVGCKLSELNTLIEENKRHKFADISTRGKIITIICRRLHRRWLDNIASAERQRRFREKGGGDPSKWTAIRVVILLRDRYICAYCGKKARTVDHIKPRSKGGGEQASNLVACCSGCNRLKGMRSIEEVGMKFWKHFDEKILQEKPDIVAEMLQKCGAFVSSKPALPPITADSEEIKHKSNAKITLLTSTNTNSTSLALETNNSPSGGLDLETQKEALAYTDKLERMLGPFSPAEKKTFRGVLDHLISYAADRGNGIFEMAIEWAADKMEYIDRHEGKNKQDAKRMFMAEVKKRTGFKAKAVV